MRDLLARTPYWKALALALAGGAALIWLQAEINAAVSRDNGRDDATYTPQGVVYEVKERLVRVESKIDILLSK